MKAYRGGQIFDGERLIAGVALVLADGLIAGVVPDHEVPPQAAVIDCTGKVVVQGFVDLQLNGGGGVMFDADPSLNALRTIANAHQSLGTRHLLPTLITSSKDVTHRAIKAVTEAMDEGVPGICGIHLEGPHLSKAKCGAHDPDLIRAMDADDLADLIAARAQIPHMLVTVAPESVTPDQVRALSDAGIVVSLGHSDADFQACMALFDAGARAATHLFNAMSQLNSRAPGLVGAALAHPDVTCGIIADGVHVHPQSLALAMATKTHDQFYLISDAMAVAGTDAQSFQLGTREVFRQDGELRLSDGTLAGADLTIPQALQTMTDAVGLQLEIALGMATQVPARLMGLPTSTWRLEAGQPCDPVILDPERPLSSSFSS